MTKHNTDSAIRLTTGAAVDRLITDPGELAYLEDCRRKPLYHDKTPRVPWSALCEAVRNSWRRNPTPRDWPVA